MSGGNVSFITCEVGLPRFSGSQAERTRRIPDQIPINRPSWPTCALQSMFLLNYDKSAAFFVVWFFVCIWSNVCFRQLLCLQGSVYLPNIPLGVLWTLWHWWIKPCHVRPHWNCNSYLIVQEDTDGLAQEMPCLFLLFFYWKLEAKWWVNSNDSERWIIT